MLYSQSQRYGHSLSSRISHSLLGWQCWDLCLSATPPHISHACIFQHNLSWTQPCTMSDGDICSNDKKYGGFGAMMANSLRRQEERQEERNQRAACSLSVFATKTADVAASRVPAGKNPPLSLSLASRRLQAASVWPTTSRLPCRAHLQKRLLLLRPCRICRPRTFFLTIPRQRRQ